MPSCRFGDPRDPNPALDKTEYRIAIGCLLNNAWSAQATASRRLHHLVIEAGIHPAMEPDERHVPQVPQTNREGGTRITALAAVLSVASPVLIFLVLLDALYYFLVRRFHALDAWLLIASSAIVMLSVVAASLGTRVTTCLMILMLAPAVTVVVCEVRGYGHQAAVLTY